MLDKPPSSLAPPWLSFFLRNLPISPTKPDQATVAVVFFPSQTFCGRCYDCDQALSSRAGENPKAVGISAQIASGLFVLFLVCSVSVSIPVFTLHCSLGVVKALAP